MPLKIEAVVLFFLRVLLASQNIKEQTTRVTS